MFGYVQTIIRCLYSVSCFDLTAQSECIMRYVEKCAQKLPGSSAFKEYCVYKLLGIWEQDIDFMSALKCSDGKSVVCFYHISP